MDLFRPALAILLTLSACGGETAQKHQPVTDAGVASPADAGPECDEAAADRCHTDGVERCVDGAWTLVARCTHACEVGRDGAQCTAPDEVCAGRTSVCGHSAGVYDCGSGRSRSCAPGRCVDLGTQSACVTDDDNCRAEDGSTLLCPNESGAYGSDTACDGWSGLCRPLASNPSCAALSNPPQCEADNQSSRFVGACENGVQPVVYECPAGSTCVDTQGFWCRRPRLEAGQTCGGTTVCAYGDAMRVGLCIDAGGGTPEAPAAPNCTSVQSSGACSGTVICGGLGPGTMAVCIDDSWFAWQNLEARGGRCDAQEALAPLGAPCFSGVVYCAEGYCDNTLPIGTCRPGARPRPPGAQAKCDAPQSNAVGIDCRHEWRNCEDGFRYRIACAAENTGGQIVARCQCLADNEVVAEFEDTTGLCGARGADLEQKAADACSWTVQTR